MSDDLVSRLRQDAEMLQDGPQRGLSELWHDEVVKDAAKDCQEAAQALTEARAEIERQANAVRLLDERCAQYERCAEQAERALAVLAPVRDMLVLCGELGGMSPGETMADYLRRLIDEVAGKETERDFRAARQLNEDLK